MARRAQVDELRVQALPTSAFDDISVVSHKAADFATRLLARDGDIALLFVRMP